MSLINLATGKEMIARYKENRELILADGYSQNILTLSETFNREDFDSLLKQADCKKIRMYFGMDADLNLRAVFVGVDETQSDILPAGGEIIAENGDRCPTICPEPSPINP